MTDKRVAPRAGLRQHVEGATLSTTGLSTTGLSATGLPTTGLPTTGLLTTGLLTTGLLTAGPSFTGPSPTGLAVTGLFVAGLLLAGCSPNAGPAGSRLRVFAADLTGAAKVCDIPNVGPVAGGNTEAVMKVVNDGGWCGLHVHQDGPKPFEAGLLSTRPDHGSVLIHEVGDETRIDYTPDRGYSGSDAFSVKLIPGDGTVHVTVTVTAATKSS